MFHIVIAGLCLGIVATPISAQLQQNPLGFQPTNNLTVAKLPAPVGWGSPPPPPPGGWPAPPPPPPPPPSPQPSNAPTPYCKNHGSATATCPAVDINGSQGTYITSTDCRCFYKCSNGYISLFECPDHLYFNPSLNVCDFRATAGCTGAETRLNSVPNDV